MIGDRGEYYRIVSYWSLNIEIANSSLWCKSLKVKVTLMVNNID